MKIEVKRFALEIISESEEDIAHIEEVLKLRTQGDKCRCERRRRDKSGTDSFTDYIEIRSEKEPKTVLF